MIQVLGVVGEAVVVVVVVVNHLLTVYDCEC